jgi:hypothetical protein
MRASEEGKAHFDDEGLGHVLLGLTLLGTLEVGPVLSPPGAHGGGATISNTPGRG